MEEKLYFAYGSNINLVQMGFRCPAAHVVGPVLLEDYQLLFRGNVRGNGVATIAPKKGHKVYGLLWAITPACECALDHYEGYPHLYGKERVTVRDKAGQKHTVMAYVMTDRYKEPSVPSSFSYNGILEGYQQNGLPVSALKKAWDHAVREVHQETERINAGFSIRTKPPKGRNRRER